MPTPIQTMADGRIRYSDGSIGYPQSSNQQTTLSKSPQYSPAGGYGSQSGKYNFVQTSNGGMWSTIPQSTNRAPIPGVSNTKDLNTTTVSAPPSSPDLSNPSKQNDWAVSQGYDGWDAYQKAQDGESRLRDSINSGFDSYKQSLSSLIPQYELDRQGEIDSIRGTYGNLRSGLFESLNSGKERLNTSRAMVDENKKNAVQDFTQNFNQATRATGMQLGAMGAGDSSASQVMAPFAYQKMAGQEFGKIGRQANQQMFEIQQAEIDLEDEYSRQITDMKVEEEQQTQSIKDKYSGVISRIREMMAGADGQRQQALMGLEQSIYERASGELDQIRGEMRQRSLMLEDWARNRMSQLNDAKIQMNNNASFDPRAITYNEMRALDQSQIPASSSAYFNPAILKKRREDLGL